MTQPPPELFVVNTSYKAEGAGVQASFVVEVAPPRCCRGAIRRIETSVPLVVELRCVVVLGVGAVLLVGGRLVGRSDLVGWTAPVTPSLPHLLPHPTQVRGRRRGRWGAGAGLAAAARGAPPAPGGDQVAHPRARHGAEQGARAEALRARDRRLAVRPAGARALLRGRADPALPRQHEPVQRRGARVFQGRGRGGGGKGGDGGPGAGGGGGGGDPREQPAEGEGGEKGGVGCGGGGGGRGGGGEEGREGREGGEGQRGREGERGRSVMGGWGRVGVWIRLGVGGAKRRAQSIHRRETDAMRKRAKRIKQSGQRDGVSLVVCWVALVRVCIHTHQMPSKGERDKRDEARRTHKAKGKGENASDSSSYLLACFCLFVVVLLLPLLPSLSFARAPPSHTHKTHNTSSSFFFSLYMSCRPIQPFFCVALTSLLLARSTNGRTRYLHHPCQT